MKNRIILSFVLLYGLIALLYSTHFGGDKNGEITSFVFLAAPFLAAFYGYKAARSYDPGNRHARALLLLATGLLLWSLGKTAFFLFRYILHINPYPSAADLAFAGGYPFLWMGLLTEIRINKASLKDFNQYVQFMIGLIMALLVLAVLYFGVYLAYIPNEPILNNLVAMSYGLGDLVLIAPTLYVLKMAVDYRGGKLFISWALITVALLLNLWGDVYFAVFRNHYTTGEWPYTMIDIIWSLGYMLFAYSFFNTEHTLKSIRSKFKKPA